MSFAHFPLAITNQKCDVFVWRERFESDDQSIFVISSLLEVKLRSPRLVEKIGVENVKLVTLHNLWWRVVRIIVNLVILVPFKALTDYVEETGFPRHKRYAILSDNPGLVRTQIVRLVQLE